MEKQIAWNDGSGDYITLTYQGQGSGTIAVSSSPNDLDVARTKTINITGGGITRQLTVTQAAAAPAYQPLTFDVLTAGTVAWLFYDVATHEPQEGGTAIEYSKNGGSWTSMPAGTSLQVLQGDRLEFRGSSSSYVSLVNGTMTSYHGFASTANVNIRGHICSLIGGGNTITADYTFNRLFNQTSVVSARDLILADNVTQYCYRSMFYGCTSLVTAPELPATTLASYCYAYMFSGCTSLVTAPELLPATTLATSCYDDMFRDCTGLVTAPELPATTLASYCYDNMFRGCTSLVTAPELPATTLASYCYRSMFYDCTALANPPALPATTLQNRCYLYMFRGCTALTTAPELPANTLVSNCYSYMFDGCSSLNYIKVKCTTKPSSTYSNYWMRGVAKSGTFVKTGSWSVTRSTDCVPTGWTVNTVSS